MAEGNVRWITSKPSVCRRSQDFETYERDSEMELHCRLMSSLTESPIAVITV